MANQADGACRAARPVTPMPRRRDGGRIPISARSSVPIRASGERGAEYEPSTKVGVQLGTFRSARNERRVDDAVPPPTVSRLD